MKKNELSGKIKKNFLANEVEKLEQMI